MLKYASETDKENVGRVGTLIGIDNTDGIFKCEETNDMIIVDMSYLGKVA